MYRVLALDPGGTTGWSSYTAECTYFYDTNGEHIQEYFDERWDQGHLGPEEHHLDLWELLNDQCVSDMVVVCESFEYRNKPRSGLDLIPKEYIGIVKLFGEERKPQGMNKLSIVFQTAAMGKGFATDNKLEAFGIMRGPKTKWPYPHINDASRHLLTYLLARQQRPDLLVRLK